MGYNLSEKDEPDIICRARRFELDRVVLFGSRARGDSWKKSDVDVRLETLKRRNKAAPVYDLERVEDSLDLLFRFYPRVSKVGVKP